MSAFLSALAGAGFGVWGAQKLAERSNRTKELLDNFRQANAVVVVAGTIANQALSAKHQYVKPFTEQYFKDRELAAELNDTLRSGRAPKREYKFQYQLTKITPLTLPIDALKSLTFSAQLMPGRALAVVSMIEQSVTELANMMEVRSEMIDVFHGQSVHDEVYCQDYFGLPRRDGNTNSMYHDSMKAISLYTDDVAFFSAELVDELVVHATQLRGKLLKLNRDVPKVRSMDFSEVRASGLMPPRENYVSWLSGFETPKDV
jgi:hypothetical protein